MSALRQEWSRARLGRGTLFLARTKCGGGDLVRVKVAGLSGDHVEGTGTRQRKGARWDGRGESAAGSADLVATGLPAADSNVRHLLVRLHEPVGVCSTCCTQPRPLGDQRCGVVWQTGVGTQVRPCAEVGAHGCLERQKRRHRPVKRTRCGQSHAGRSAGRHQATPSPFKCKLGPGVSGGSAPELPWCAPDEDVVAAGVQHPVVPFTRIIIMARHFDETLVETQVVPDWVLPPLSVLSVVWEVVHDELVDAVKCEPPVRTLADRHHDESVIAERRFLRFAVFLRTSAFLGILFVSFWFTVCILWIDLHRGSLLLLLELLFVLRVFFWTDSLWLSGAQFVGRRGRLLLRRYPLSPPQQAADAEWGLVEKSVRSI